MYRAIGLAGLLCSTGCLSTIIPAHPNPGGADGSGAAGDGAGALSSTTFTPIAGDTLWVVNGGDSTLSVIDVANSQVAATVTLNNAMFPHHISLSSDRSKLLVAVPGMDLSAGHDGTAGPGGGAVMMLDATNGKTLAVASLDMMNHNAIFSPDGTEVWTSQMMMPGSVLVLDATTLAKKQEIAVGDMPAEITFSKDGKMAFVANGMSDSVSIIDLATKTVMATVAVGKDPVGPWTGIDGVMYTDCEQGKSISAIDSTSMMVTRTYALGFTPGMAATPSAKPGELWITDVDGGKLVFNSTAADLKSGELAVGAGAHGITFSADGATAFVTNQGAGTLSVVDVAAKTVKGTLTVGNKPNGVVFRSN